MKIEDILQMLKSYSIRKRLAALAVMITKKDQPLQLNTDGGSYTDGRKIVIGVPMEIMTKMLEKGIITTKEQVLAILKGLGAHEAEHIRSSSFPLFRKFMELVEEEYKTVGIRGAGQVIGRGIMNAVEDGRIERRSINRYPGIKKHIQFMNLSFHQIVGFVQNDILRDYLMSICTIATSNMHLVGWNETYGGTEIAQLLKDVLPHIRDGVAAETPEACYDACLEIHKLTFPILKTLVKENLEKQKQGNNFAQDDDIEQNPMMDNADRRDAPGNKQQQYSKSKSKKGKPQQSQGMSLDSEDEKDKQKGSGKGEKDDTKDKEQSEDGEQGDGQGQEGQDQNQDSQEGNGQKNDDSQESNDSADSQDSSNSDNNGIGDGAIGMDEPIELSGEELAELIKEINDIIYNDNKKNVADAIKEDAQQEKADAARKAKRAKNRLNPKDLSNISHNHKATYQEFDSQDPLDGRSMQRAKDLEKTILRILRNKKTEELRYRRSGTIDKRSYVRFVVNKENDVFFKDEKNEIDDVAFYVLIDHSGSMHGQNMALALTSASVIQEAIQKHCPLRVVGFNSGGNSTVLYDYKDFDDKANGSLVKFARNSNNANCDGYAIKVATGELSKRSEKVKILFVLSDGYPTVTYKTDPILDSKEAVIDAKKKGIIVIPIVFGVDSCNRENFETIYEKNIIMCEPVDIEKHLSKLLEKVIKVI